MKVYQLFSYVTTFERVTTEYFVTVRRIGDVVLDPEDASSYHHHGVCYSREAAIRELERVLTAAALFSEDEFEGWVIKSSIFREEEVASEVVKHLTAGRSFYIQLTEVK